MPCRSKSDFHRECAHGYNYTTNECCNHKLVKASWYLIVVFLVLLLVVLVVVGVRHEKRKTQELQDKVDVLKKSNMRYSKAYTEVSLS